MKDIKILIIEDDKILAHSLKTILNHININFTIMTASTAEVAYKLLNEDPDLAFIDISLHEKIEGFKLTKYAKQREIYSVILSSFDSDEFVEKGVIESKADSYLVKPANLTSVKNVIDNYFSQIHSKKSLEVIRKKYITQDPETIASLNLVNNVYDSDCSVNIVGPSGVGKGLIAKIIHELKYTNNQNFIEVNCSSYSENLIESELFGHEKGAFTGASDQHIGAFEKAHNGTLFLDELGTMSQSMQDKILKVIEDKSFYRVGGRKKIKSNFRLITATSSDLEQMVKDGSFKLDLFFRINCIHIKLKALHKRKCDIMPTVRYLFDHLGHGKKIIIKKDAIELIKSYSWPGNTREIKNLVEKNLTLNKNVITKDLVQDHIDNFTKISKRNKDGHLTDEMVDTAIQVGASVFLENLKEELTWKIFVESDFKVRETMRIAKVGQKYLEMVRRKYGYQ